MSEAALACAEGYLARFGAAAMARVLAHVSHQ